MPSSYCVIPSTISYLPVLSRSLLLTPAQPPTLYLVVCCSGWHLVFQHLRDLSGAINATLKALGENNSTQLSATTRRKLTARALEHLHLSRDNLKVAGSELQSLYKWSIELKERVGSAENGQDELLRQLEAVATDTHALQVRTYRMIHRLYSARHGSHP